MPYAVNRFSRKQYADIEIVQTEKKGFGIRAGSDLSAYVQLFSIVAWNAGFGVN